MGWKRITLAIILSVYAGAIITAPLGWLLGTFAPDFVVRGLEQDTTGGMFQPAEFALGYAACWGALFGFVTGVLIVCCRPRQEQ
jgi:hypothetical protein